MLIRVSPEALTTDEAVSAVASPSAGAIDVFLGVVRNENLGREVAHLEYDAYPAMAERVMRQIGDEARERFELRGVCMLHRTGHLEIGETSLVVAVSAAHRAVSFEACRWIVDEVKRRVPVWKKEVWGDGEEWIEGPESLGAQRPAALR